MDQDKRQQFELKLAAEQQKFIAALECCFVVIGAHQCGVLMIET